MYVSLFKKLPKCLLKVAVPFYMLNCLLLKAPLVIKDPSGQSGLRPHITAAGENFDKSLENVDQES